MDKKLSEYKNPAVDKDMIIEDIELTDDETSTGGVAFNHERLSDFLEDIDNDTQSIADINKELVACGIKPITLEQIKVIGIKGE